MQDNPNLLFRPMNRISAAMVRAETAQILFQKKRYSAAIYMAGVAVECVLRAFIENDEKKFSDKHSISSMIRKPAIVPLLKENDQMSLWLDTISNYWDNKYRYADDKKIMTFYYSAKMIKKESFKRPETLRPFAEDCCFAANEIAAVGFILAKKRKIA